MASQLTRSPGTLDVAQYNMEAYTSTNKSHGGDMINPIPELHFTFKDSCNCCFPKKSNVDPQVYIHADGSTDKFSPRKAKDLTASEKRCIANLDLFFASVASDFDLSPVELKTMVELYLQQDLRVDEPVPVTKETANKINAYITKILKDLGKV